MMKHVWKWALPLALAVALLAVAAAYLLPGLTRWLNIYDEGLMAYGAVRVLDGQAPYRDFWAMYSPAQFYVLAGLFRLFGPSIAVERMWDIALRAALAFAIYLVAGRLSNRWIALLAWAMSVIWLEYFGFYGYPVFAGLLFVMLSLYALLRAFEQPRWLWAAGILAGVAALFRHDLAVYAVIPEVIVIAGYTFAHSDRSLPRRRRLAGGLRGLIPYAVGLAAVVAPVALALVLTAPLSELLQQLLIFPLTIFPRMRDLPYPPPAIQNLPFYFPFLAYALAAVLMVVKARRPAGEQDRRQAWGIAAVILFGLFGFNQANIRSDLIHIPQFFLPAVALLPALFIGFRPALKRDAWLMSTFMALIAVLLCLDPIFAYADAYPSQPVADSGLARARGMPVDPNQLKVIRYLQQHTSPGDTIFSGVKRHDRVFVNDVMLYFLAERHAATRYHELHPGVATTEPVQQEIAASLERNRARYVVLTDMFEGASEPNDSAKSSGVTLLDDYIVRNYTPVYAAGSYRILRRNDAPQ